MPTTPLTPVFDPGATETFRSEDALGVRFDLFPAEVRFTAAAGGVTEYPKCRVLISADAVYVFIDGPRAPVLLYYDRLDDLTGDLIHGFTITPANPTLTGISSVQSNPTQRCGCGSRLRSYRPFAQLSYIPTTSGANA